MSEPIYLYHYDDTGINTGVVTVARMSPKEPDVPLIPRNTTTKKPPSAGAGQAAVFADGAWALQEDHRGETVYSTDDGSEFKIQEIGPVPAGYTDQPRPSDWHVWQNGAWQFDTARLAEYREQAKMDADVQAGSVRMRFPSPGDLTAEEYMQAETEAKAFKDAGYPSGSVPDEVQCWADAESMTAQQACDDILNTAAVFREALRQIRRERLVGKANIDNAADHATVDTARDNALAALDAITPQSVAASLQS